MLSGQAPFYSRPRVDTASSVMRRIKEGDFRLDGEAWKLVSASAKQLCKGLLTVDPRKRVSLEQLASAPWLQSSTAPSSAFAPLMTPALLVAEPSTERCIKQTYDAFHNATREGFRLFPVSPLSSKLLQKRKLKQSVSTETTISSSSDRSSFGSKSSGSSYGGGGMCVGGASAKFWSGAVHQGAAKGKEAEAFSFQGAAVQEYLSAAFGSSAAYSAALLPAATPLNIPLSVNVSAYSSHPPPLPYPAATPFPSYLGSAGVSLSIISPPVISPPSQRLGCAPDCACAGPLTRSRKRKLCGAPSPRGDTLDLKTKCTREGTITIE